MLTLSIRSLLGSKEELRESFSLEDAKLLFGTEETGFVGRVEGEVLLEKVDEDLFLLSFPLVRAVYQGEGVDGASEVSQVLLENTEPRECYLELPEEYAHEEVSEVFSINQVTFQLDASELLRQELTMWELKNM